MQLNFKSKLTSLNLDWKCSWYSRFTFWSYVLLIYRANNLPLKSFSIISQVKVSSFPFSRVYFKLRSGNLVNSTAQLHTHTHYNRKNLKDVFFSYTNKFNCTVKVSNWEFKNLQNVPIQLFWDSFTKFNIGSLWTLYHLKVTKNLFTLFNASIMCDTGHGLEITKIKPLKIKKYNSTFKNYNVNNFLRLAITSIDLLFYSSRLFKVSFWKIRFFRLYSNMWYAYFVFKTWMYLQNKVYNENLYSKKYFYTYFKFQNYFIHTSRWESSIFLEHFILQFILHKDSIGIVPTFNTLYRYSKFWRLGVVSSPTRALLNRNGMRTDKSISLIWNRKNIKRVFYSNFSSKRALAYQTYSFLHLSSTPHLSNKTKKLPHSIFEHQKLRKRFLNNSSWWHRLTRSQIYPSTQKLVRTMRWEQVYLKIVFRIAKSLNSRKPSALEIIQNSLQSIKISSYSQKILWLSNTEDTDLAFTLQPIWQSISIYQQLVTLVFHDIMLATDYKKTPSQLDFQYNSKYVSPVELKDMFNISDVQFTSWTSFITLAQYNSTNLWKYTLVNLNLLSVDSITSFSLKYYFQYISQLITFILRSQFQAYKCLNICFYATYSNLSVIHWEEHYAQHSVRRLLSSTFALYSIARYFQSVGFLWYYTSLLQFLEDTTGRKVVLNFGPFLETVLTFSDRARCITWGSRILGFQRILGPKIFIHEALEILVASLRLKDPTFLANWIRVMLVRISFWKYRLLFRYLKFLLQNLLRPSFNYFNFKGAKFRLKGKISVAGNARTRMWFYRIGCTSHTTMANRIAYDLSYINTFTGIQGFKVWFFY